MVLVEKLSDCGDGAKEEEGRVVFRDKKDGTEHQRWNDLVLAQPFLVEGLQQQPQLPGAAAPTLWPSPQAPLPPQQSVEHSGSRTSSSQSYLALPPRTRGHPQCQHILMRATASGRLEGIIFWLLFWEVRAIASRMEAIGSEKALATRGFV